MKLKKFLRFRLWMILLLMTLFAVALAIFVPLRERYQREHDSLAAIRSRAKHVVTMPGKPRWLEPIVGKEVYSNVVHLSMQGAARHVGRGFGDIDMRHLANFPELRRLSLQSTDVTAAGLVHLSGLQKLNALSLEMAPIARDGLRHLKDLTNLRHLNLSYSPTANQLHYLKKLEKLEELECGSVADVDMETIASFPKLRILKMLSYGPSCQAVEKLNGHPSLEELHLAVEHVDSHLSDCPNLKFLYVSCYGDSENRELVLTNLPKLEELVRSRNRSYPVRLNNVPLLKVKEP
ncbi:MAG: hypothetical protein KDB27_34470 [Planctomycetales bacterium]|nr:hypothetical protein [Planctomycetales bacterium]